MTTNKMIDDSKVNGYLSMFNFILAFGIGYFYGMHWAAVLTAFVSLAIAYNRADINLPVYKQTWTFASPFVMLIAVAIINATVLPFALAGTLFTLLGIRLKKWQSAPLLQGTIAFIALSIATYGGWVLYPKYAQNILLREANITLGTFELTRMDGSAYTYTPNQNQVVLIDFWATWCKPCRDEFVELERVVAHFDQNENVQILIANAANSGDSWQKSVAFVNNNNFELPFYLDQSGAVTSMINVTQFPTLALVAPNGEVQFIHEGYSNAENLDQFLIEQIEELIATSIE